MAIADDVLSCELRAKVDTGYHQLYPNPSPERVDRLLYPVDRQKTTRHHHSKDGDQSPVDGLTDSVDYLNE